jgi:hypothetical protein
MNWEQRDERLRPTPRRICVFVFPSILALLLHISAAAGAKPPAGGSSPSGGQNASSASQSPQPPPIPLDLAFFTSCTRPEKHLDHQTTDLPECDEQPRGAAKVEPVATPFSKCQGAAISKEASKRGLWTAEENCQLSLAYNQARWCDAQKLIINFIRNLTCTPKQPSLVEDAYYSVVFLNEDLPTPTLSRLLVHNPFPEIYGNRVGQYDLYDLQLLPDFGISVTTTYQASTAPNGVIAQLPGVLAQAANASKSLPAPTSLQTTSNKNLEILNATSQLLQAFSEKLVKTDSASEEAAVKENLALIDKIKTENLVSEEGLTESTKSLTVERGRLTESQSSPSEKANAFESLKLKLPEIDKAIINLLADQSATIVNNTRYVIRRVNSPSAFKRGGLRTASVIPQVSVTDQVAPSKALEGYLLEQFSLRAARKDQDLENRYCQTKPCTKPVSIVSIVNERLADQYRKCRSAARSVAAPSIQLNVSADRPSYALNNQTVTLTAQLNEAISLSLPSKLQASFQWYSIGSAVPVLCPSTPSVSTTLTWTGTCAVAQLPLGAYLVKASMTEVPRAGVSFVPIGALPEAYTSIVVTDTSASGSLILADRMPSWGMALNANYTVNLVARNSVDVFVKVFNAQDPSKEVAVSPTTRINPSLGVAEGAVKFDTGSLGKGEWIAVLVVDTGSGLKNLAAVNFTVGARGATAQPASGGPGSASSCSFDPAIQFSSLDGLTETQEFALDRDDLATAYTALFAFSNPGQQPNTPPAPTQYTFGKLTRWAYSLGVGGLFPAFHNPPAKTTATGFMRDSPSPGITFVAADFHPARYDETTFSPTLAERFRFFGGLAITPNVGVVVGAGLGLFRGLTLEAGCASLLGNVLPSGSSFTNPNPVPNPQTRRGFFYAPFIALGYSFQ